MKPPALALRLMDLFSQDPQHAAVTGDLWEEYQARGSKLGEDAARRWFWGQTLHHLWIFYWREVTERPMMAMRAALMGLIAFQLTGFAATGAIARVLPGGLFLVGVAVHRLIVPLLIGAGCCRLLGYRGAGLAAWYAVLSLALALVSQFAGPTGWHWIARSFEVSLASIISFHLGALWMTRRIPRASA